MNNPKISIIIPVYNTEQYIGLALDSVVNQTLKDIEIICIDDCSTDNSYEILKDYASKDDRFVVLKQETNQGQGAARNKALDIAKGEYIMFLDSDDWFEDDACELCYNQITKNQNDIVLFAHNRYQEENGEKKYFDKMLKPFEKYKKYPQIKLDNVSEPFIVTSYTVMFIYRKDLLDENNIRYPNYKNFEDHIFYTKVMLCADNLSVIDKPLYNYRINKKSSTFTLNNQQNDILSVKQEILEELQKGDVSINKKIAIHVYTIKNSLYWLKHYSKIFKPIEKDFYNSVKKIFSMTCYQFVSKYVKNKIEKKYYTQYKNILKYDYDDRKENNIFNRLKKLITRSQENHSTDCKEMEKE